MSVAESIAEHVFAERKRRKWSRIALAEQASVGKTVVWDIEHAKPTVRLQTLLQVCGALDMTLQILSGESATKDVVSPPKPPKPLEPILSEISDGAAIAVNEVVADELPDYLL